MRELGEAVGVTAQAVAQWEKSEPRFSKEREQIVANILEVDKDWLRGQIQDDETPARTENYLDAEGKVPIIDINHAVIFMVLASDKTRRKDLYKGFLIPSARIIGQPFAVVCDKESAGGPILEGDILVFDNGIKPIPGDIFIGISMSGDGEGSDVIRSHLAGLVQATSPDGETTTAAFDLRHLDDQENSQLPGGVTPIAVMVERRRLRRR